MEKETYTIEKTLVECYKLRSTTGSYWADITIDSIGTKGRIQIASDFGSYQNYWGACGCSFKEFLQRLNIEYAADKFGEDKWFDLDATIKLLRERILDEFHHEDDKDEVLSELKELESCSNKEEFCDQIRNCKNIWQMEDGMPSLCYAITPQFKRFWDEIWPVFIDHLKKEK
jgi:hypothetical protein